MEHICRSKFNNEMLLLIVLESIVDIVLAFLDHVPLLLIIESVVCITTLTYLLYLYLSRRDVTYNLRYTWLLNFLIFPDLNWTDFILLNVHYSSIILAQRVNHDRIYCLQYSDDMRAAFTFTRRQYD